jgi:hypothetical protein
MIFVFNIGLFFKIHHFYNLFLKKKNTLSILSIKVSMIQQNVFDNMLKDA